MARRKAGTIQVDISANVAKIQSDLERAVGLFNQFGKRVEGVGKTVKAAFAYQVGKDLLPMLADLSTAAFRMAALGDKASDVRTAFEKLGGSSASLEQARKAMLGTVDSFELMEAANKGLIRNIPEFNDKFGQLAEYAKRFAEATGQEAKPALESLVAALGKGSAKGLSEFGFKLDGIDSKTERVAEALRQLPGLLNDLPPATDSVAEAWSSFNKTIEQSQKSFGIGINASEELTRGLRNVEQTVNDVNWESLGRSVAKLGGEIAEAASVVTDFMSARLNDFAAVLEYVTGSSTIAKIAKLNDEIETLQERSSSASNYSIIDNTPYGPQNRKRDKAQLAELTSQRDALMNEERERRAKENDARVQAEKDVLDKQERLAAEARARDIAAQKAAEEEKAKARLESAKKSFAELIQRNNETSLKGQITTAIDALKIEDAQNLINVFQEAVRVGFVQEWNEKFGGVVPQEFSAELQRQSAIAATEAGNEFRDKLSRAGKDAARETQLAFQNSFSEVANSLGQIGDAFGVNLNPILDTLNTFFKEEMGDIMQSLAEKLGTDAEGLQAGFAAGAQVISDVASAKDLDKQTDSNAGTGRAVGSAGGATVGAILGGPQGAALGSKIGSFIGEIVGGLFGRGAQDPSTKARRAVEQYIEDVFIKAKAVGFFNREGGFNTVQGSNINWTTGASDRFSTPGWAENINSFTGQANATFNGLADALKEFLGISEDIGNQLGVIFGENLAGNIDNAKLLVMQLGLSLEDLSEALFNMAKRGEITWHEYAVELQGIAKAFEPGLEKMGDLQGAVNELFGSGGRGVAALKAVKDIAHEAIEQGATDLEGLRNRLVATGLDPETVGQIIEAFRQGGITTLQQVEKLSDQQTAMIVANIQSQATAVADEWSKIGANLEKIKWDLNDLPKEKDIKIRFSATLDANMNRVMNSGVLDGNMTSISSPAINGASVSGAQVASSTRSAGSVSAARTSSVNISIDARGADASVEQRVMSAVLNVQDRIAKQAASIVIDNQARGR